MTDGIVAELGRILASGGPALAALRDMEVDARPAPDAMSRGASSADRGTAIAAAVFGSLAGGDAAAADRSRR